MGGTCDITLDFAKIQDEYVDLGLQDSNDEVSCE